ncbi:MAG: NTP transferase domain-containing protein [Ignavibacteria bacterium]|nr:NTP transferase domain-containing protein [Ignavibacteria bacterium]
MPITDTDFNNKNSAFLENQLAELMKRVKETERDTGRKLAVVILAAGLGKRMKSADKPKVMFEINNKPMIEYVVELAFKINADLVVPIVGYHREQVINYLDDKFKGKDIKYVVQAEQLGTGHAVIQTKDLLKDFNGDILILSGDVPLLKYETIKKLIEEHISSGNMATLLTTVFKDSFGYGRIVRDEDGRFSKIVEEKDATDEEKMIKEINPAIYIVNAELLFETLSKISPENNQKEYYLTDIFNFIPKGKTGTVVTNDELEVTGVNSVEQLKQMEEALNSR